MKKINYEKIGRSIACETLKGKFSFSAGAKIAFESASQYVMSSIAAFAHQHATQCISKEIKDYASEHGIESISDVMHYGEDEGEAKYGKNVEKIRQMLKNQAEKEATLKDIELKKLKDTNGLKASYDKINKSLVKKLGPISLEMEKAKLFMVVSGFLDEYCSGAKIALDSSVRDEFRAKFMEDKISFEDIAQLSGSLELTAQTSANLYTAVVNLFSDKLLVLGVKYQFGLDDSHFELLRLLQPIANEHFNSFIYVVLQQLKLNEIPLLELSKRVESGDLDIKLSAIDVLNIVSDLPKELSSRDIVSLLESDFIKKLLPGHAGLTGYHAIMHILETIGSSGGSSKDKISAGIDHLRSIGKEEIAAIALIESALKAEKFDVDHLPQVYTAAKRLETVSSTIMKLFTGTFGDLGSSYTDKLSNILSIEKEIGEQTVEDIIFISKLYADKPSEDEFFDALDDEVDEQQTEDESFVSKSAQDIDFEREIEVLKRIRDMSGAQAKVITNLGLLDAQLLTSIRGIPDQVFNIMHDLVKDSIKLSTQDDQVSIVLSMIKNLNTLDAPSIGAVKKLIIKLAGDEVDLKVDQAFTWAEKISGITDEMYVIMKDVVTDVMVLSKSEDPLQSTLGIINNLSRLSPEHVGVAKDIICLSVGEAQIERFNAMVAWALSESDDVVKTALDAVKELSKLSPDQRYAAKEIIRSLWGGAQIENVNTVFALADQIDGITDEMYETIKGVVIDAMALRESDDPVESTLDIIKKLSRLSTDEREVARKIIRLSAEDQVDNFDMVLGWADQINGISDDMYDTIKDVVTDAMALAGSDDPVLSTLGVIQKISGLSPENKNVVKNIVIFSSEEAQGENIDAMFALADKISAISDELYGKLSGITTDIKGLCSNQGVNVLQRTLRIINEINALSSDEKEVCRSLVALAGDEFSDKCNNFFDYASLCDEDKVGLEQLEEVLRKVTDTGQGIVDLTLGNATKYRFHLPTGAIRELFNANVAINAAKTVFMSLTIASITLAFLLPVYLPFAIAVIAGAAVHLLGIFSYKLYKLSTSNNNLVSFREEINKCETSNDAVRFLTVLMKGDLEDNNPNEPMVKAAKLLSNVEPTIFTGVVTGALSDAIDSVSKSSGPV